MKADILTIQISKIRDLPMPNVPGWFQCFLVEGKTTRNDVYIDFTEAGNWKRYDWLEKGEFCVGCHDSTEVIPDMIHEVAEVVYAIEHELDIMNNDDDYSEAHDFASSIEQPVRDKGGDFRDGIPVLKEWLDRYMALRPQETPEEEPESEVIWQQ